MSRLVSQESVKTQENTIKLSSNGHGKEKIPSDRGTMLTILSLLIDLISFTIILPLLPSILSMYKNSDSSGLYSNLSSFSSYIASLVSSKEIKGSDGVIIGGILGSGFSLLQFISAPLVGAVSDRRGRRVSLIGCLIGIILSHVIWIYSSNFGLFVLARVIGGLSRSNVSIVTTIIADDSRKEFRPRGMALIGVAFSIGFTLGPALGAYYARQSDFSTPAIISCCLSILSLLIVIFFVPETLNPDERKSNLMSMWNYLSPVALFKFRAVSNGAQLIPLGLTYFIYIFFYSGLEFTLTFLTHEKLNYSPKDQGKMFCYVGVSMTLIQGLLTRRLKNGAEAPAALFGIFIMIPAFIIIGLSNSPLMLYSGITLYSIGSGVVGPCLTSLAASRVKCKDENGVSLGIFRSLGALARSLGPLFSSALFWTYGPEFAYLAISTSFFIPLFLLKHALETGSEKGKKME